MLGSYFRFFVFYQRIYTEIQTKINFHNKNSNIMFLNKKKYLKSTLGLFSFQVTAILCSLFIKYRQTSLFSVDDFGCFSLWITSITCISIIARFGFLSASQLSLAHTNDLKQERQLKGATFSIVCVLFVFIGLLSFFTGNFLIKSEKYSEVGFLLSRTSPLAGCMLLPYLVQATSVGTGNLRYHGASKLFVQVLFMCFLYMPYIKNPLDMTWLYLTAIGVSTLIIFIRSGISFKNLGEGISKLSKTVKNHGIYIYFGQLADQLTLHLDTLCIAYFVTVEEVGLYALASSIFIPLSLLNTSICQVLFKHISKIQYLDKKFLILQSLFLLSISLFVMWSSNILIPIIFSKTYEPVCLFTFPMMLRAFIGGFYEPYNVFLCGKGKGKWTKNVSLIMAVVNILSFVSMTWVWGGARCGMGFCYWKTHLYDRHHLVL